MRTQISLAFAFAAIALGCGSSGDVDAGYVCADCGRDAGPPPPDAGDMDAGAPDAGDMDAGEMDAGEMDAGGDLDGGGPTDAAVPASDAAEGAACSLNRECAASQRCECDSMACICATGPRGTGQNGIDVCTDGNECESSLCVEGAADTFYCSGECLTDTDCEAGLPRCLDLAFLGRICTRVPPGS